MAMMTCIIHGGAIIIKLGGGHHGVEKKLMGHVRLYLHFIRHSSGLAGEPCHGSFCFSFLVVSKINTLTSWHMGGKSGRLIKPG